MGGCCIAQQLAIRWKKQLSLRNIGIFKLSLYRNLYQKRKEDSNIAKYTYILNIIKAIFANFFSC